MVTELDLDFLIETPALINEFGLDATFHVDGGAGDPGTSTWVPAVIDYVRKVTPPGAKKVYRQGEASAVEQTTTYVADAGLGFQPAPGLRLTVDGRSYTAVNVIAWYSGFLVAVWELRLE